ncbi:hypothetical protein PHYSODRAFT_306225 [Phytophthora sojae]|uniref:RxLR effector protein n=1 Tax=Phytophthora sojae (strain P6497) TaxID=1094619 RepID=G5A8H1_PHYSP|nr:hypothetical protein PHYSODRAFT_306225 [Phytophthora sojae]EGZ08197.1 hypothetical protein PHYSODRAFT_306225 [Phytophthora sojae]|eukprot:XP_009536369.1 hypothetical protein PHYSODRAFT_306225 [Phytophthora sojae]
MRWFTWAVLTVLAAVLAASNATSLDLGQNTAADTTSDSQNDSDAYGKRYLAGVVDSPQVDYVKEERNVLSSGVSTLISKLKRSVRKLKLHYEDLRKKRFLTKMEVMFKAGTTPEKLADLYGSTKKVKLQTEFRQFYKWRSGWTEQAQKYPKPGNLKAIPKLERLG